MILRILLSPCHRAWRPTIDADRNRKNFGPWARQAHNPPITTAEQDLPMPTKTKKDLNPIAGSERGLRAGSKLIGPCNPDERVELTIRVRSRSPKKYSAAAIGALLPAKRRYLTRDQFAAAHGAAPADLAKVKAFATKSGLEVVSESLAERSVKVAGTVRAVSTA